MEEFQVYNSALKYKNTNICITISMKKILVYEKISKYKSDSPFTALLYRKAKFILQKKTPFI
jgi:hypothetical protein